MQRWPWNPSSPKCWTLEPSQLHRTIGDEWTMAFSAHELWAADYRLVFEREYEALQACYGHGYAHATIIVHGLFLA